MTMMTATRARIMRRDMCCYCTTLMRSISIQGEVEAEEELEPIDILPPTSFGLMVFKIR